ncbi:uncharacterized protein LOC132797609 [Drosophila nasuta]|uniref:uncharacterized protein LOC132797609 n=1 Tax=Drosophila nasuta TaxID=42062 RepID=UPI00295EC167|nr:uncharacterized protein LOC132797609 [Drosophila nasuta]
MIISETSANFAMLHSLSTFDGIIGIDLVTRTTTKSNFKCCNQMCKILNVRKAIRFASSLNLKVIVFGNPYDLKFSTETLKPLTSSSNGKMSAEICRLTYNRLVDTLWMENA